jgi:hypothetical protein
MAGAAAGAVEMVEPEERTDSVVVSATGAAERVLEAPPELTLGAAATGSLAAGPGA